MLRSVALLATILVTSQVATSDEPELVTIHLKQGCSFECPKSLTILDKSNVLKIETKVAETAASISPKLKEKVEKATLAFFAADGQKNPPCQMSLLILPAEISQQQLKEFEADQLLQLREIMHQQSADQFTKLRISVTKKLPPEVKAGASLSYFLWGYEFVDDDKIPKVSIRAYYYTEAATFILGISCHKTYFDANSKTLYAALESFRTSDK